MALFLLHCRGDGVSERPAADSEAEQGPRYLSADRRGPLRRGLWQIINAVNAKCLRFRSIACGPGSDSVFSLKTWIS